MTFETSSYLADLVVSAHKTRANLAQIAATPLYDLWTWLTSTKPTRDSQLDLQSRISRP
jgi:hypothetical protein